MVVLNIGGVVETASWKNETDAILLAWQPGQEAGNAVAQILAGEVSPSGKLTMTFPVKYSDVPSANYFPDPSTDPKQTDYTAGTAVGYRYYRDADVATSYEFGFGLSYTDFTYNNLSVDSLQEKQFKIELSVTNTGVNNGKEVVQLYLKA